jgi:hypothetical protein
MPREWHSPSLALIFFADVHVADESRMEAACRSGLFVQKRASKIFNHIHPSKGIWNLLGVADLQVSEMCFMLCTFSVGC